MNATPKQLEGYKARAAKIREQLEAAGFQSSAGGMTTGLKLVVYFVTVAGVESSKEMSVAQWDAVFSGLDALEPKQAVEAVEQALQQDRAKKLIEELVEDYHARTAPAPREQVLTGMEFLHCLAKFTDPNATPEERQRAKELAELYGLDPTRLVQ